MNTGDFSVSCYICSSTALKDIGERNGIPLVKCNDCKIIYVPPNRIDDDLLRDFYSQDYFESDSIIGYKNYIHEETIHRRNAGRILDRYLKVIPRETPAVLDLGCAFGFFLDEARKRGCEVTGVEMSAFARHYATDQLRLAVHHDLQSVVDQLPGKFDAVFLLGTIEHLSNAREVLSGIRDVLKPGGVLVVTTVDTAGLLPLYALKPPEHLIYFNRRNLASLLEQTGFSLSNASMYFAYYLVGDLLHRLAEFFRAPVFERLSQMAIKRAPDCAEKRCRVLHSENNGKYTTIAESGRLVPDHPGDIISDIQAPGNQIHFF